MRSIRTIAGIVAAAFSVATFSLAPVTAGQPAAAAHAATLQTAKRTLKTPHTRFQLKNGMTVILHEDHSQPLVVLNVNVNVGSRDEPKRRTGFAHLFEHLMFMGTKRVPEKMFDAWMEAEGAWNNAWTSNDRTDYYDVGPSHTLPLLLWLESDRLGTLGSQIDQEKLDSQRDVVRNERRQTVENRPYQKAELRLSKLLFPEGHPYHHPVIGSHEDLEAASVDDVRTFFKQWYAPANMSVVVAGDFSPDVVTPLLERYFGGLAAAPAPERRKPATPAKLTGVVRETLEDRVSLSKVTMAWLSPAAYESGDAELDMLSEVLTEGKASRLYKSLVYDRQIAQTVTAYQASQTLRSHFNIEVIVRPDVALSTIEEAIDKELSTLREELISEAELNRAKNQYEARFIQRMQSLATRAALLNGYFAHHGEPDFAQADLQRYLDVTIEDVRDAARRILKPQQRVILHIVPKAGDPAKTAQ